MTVLATIKVLGGCPDIIVTQVGTDLAHHDRVGKTASTVTEACRLSPETSAVAVKASSPRAAGKLSSQTSTSCGAIERVMNESNITWYAVR
jgi:hypothetical protein